MIATYIRFIAAALIAFNLAWGAVRSARAQDLPAVKAAQLTGDEARTRFVLDLSAPLKAVAFPLTDPWRVVIDLPDVVFQLPPDIGQKPHGLIVRWRWGQVAAGKSRLVLETKGPISIDKIYVMDPVGQQPAHLVVDLLPRVGTQEIAKEPAATSDSGAQPPLAPSTSMPLKPRPIVVIDAGHGGQDSGAIGATGTVEKTVTLAMARAVRAVLLANHKVDVVLSREEDIFVALGDRVEFAQSHKADLFVSIHADSIASQTEDVRGATIYTLSEKASDRDAAKLAEKENAADAVGGVQIPDKTGEVSDILLDLARQETKNFSLAFARGLEQEISTTTKMSKTPHRSAGFRVLRTMNIPSSLIELGYLSNPLDEKLLTTSGWQQRMAVAIAQSIEAFFAHTRAASN